jgi:phosphatidylserine/phosphatidylglycerophosphate/cardiolipin synthase-like enzyme
LSNFKILKSPWEKDFVRLLGSTKRHVRLASPFIKTDVASLIAQNVRAEARIDFLSSFKLANFHRGSSDLEALSLLLHQDASIRNYHRLHAKIFVFDDKRAVVTSANLTPGGLFNNYEYGILIEDEKLSVKIALDFKKIFDDKDLTGDITSEIIDTASAILAAIPKEKGRRFAVAEETLLRKVAEEHDRYEGGTESIQKNLKGWEKDVFDVLNEIDLDIFKLKDVYEYEERLSKLHPENKFVKAKIRQQLQQLRDLGLIEFLERGIYRKLWK